MIFVKNYFLIGKLECVRHGWFKFAHKVKILLVGGEWKLPFLDWLMRGNVASYVIANDHLYDRIDLTHYKMFGKNGIVWWHVTVLYFTAASALPTLANWQKSSLATTPFESTSPSKTSSSSSPTCRWIDRITFWEQIQCFDHQILLPISLRLPKFCKK